MMYQWMYEQKTSHMRKKRRKAELEKFRRIVLHKDTQEKTTTDFPLILDYLEEKFPSVDLVDTKIYIVTPEVINKVIPGIGGCYVPDINTIFVKNEIKSVPVGKFQKLMHEEVKQIDVEDVIVHELIHAVSFTINRASSAFSHMEEEFVYLNCIDFYKRKGISDEDIVNHNFLPFFISNVIGSYNSMRKILPQAGLHIEDTRGLSPEQYSAYLNKHAEKLVPLVKEKSRNNAYQMIDLYEKYGVEMFQNSATEHDNNRFAHLDLD